MEKTVHPGKIDISALYYPPERHEYETARYFAKLGFDIVFIKPRSIKGSHDPDFFMKGRNWETKSPKLYSKSSFDYNCRKAQKQSEHIIFDLRRLNKIDEQKYLTGLKKWSKMPQIKTLLVITKDGNLLLKLKKIVNTSAFDKIVINTKHNYTKEELCQKELARPRSMVIFYQTLIS